MKKLLIIIAILAFTVTTQAGTLTFTKKDDQGVGDFVAWSPGILQEELTTAIGASGSPQNWTINGSKQRIRINLRDSFHTPQIEQDVTDAVLLHGTQAKVDERAQAKVDYAQKQVDAKSQLSLNDLSDKTYAQAESWIENNVTDIASAKAVLKKMVKIILAILKKGDFSD